MVPRTIYSRNYVTTTSGGTGETSSTWISYSDETGTNCTQTFTIVGNCSAEPKAEPRYERGYRDAEPRSPRMLRRTAPSCREGRRQVFDRRIVRGPRSRAQLRCVAVRAAKRRIARLARGMIG